MFLSLLLPAQHISVSRPSSGQLYKTNQVIGTKQVL